MDVVTNVTVITVNFKTPELIGDAVTTFRAFYSSLPYILIDNGGCSASLKICRDLASRHGLHLVENAQNIGHGPALDQGIHLADTPYVFTLDSDTRTEKPGFLEAMLSEFQADENLFGIGWLRYVNEGGVASPRPELKRGIPYVHPYASLIDRDKYLGEGVHPYIQAGSPATKLMHSIGQLDYTLKSFPIEDYVWHKIAGTRGKFRGQCIVPTDRKPGRWRHHRI